MNDSGLASVVVAMSCDPSRALEQPTERDAKRWAAFEAAITAHHGDLHAFAYRVVGGRPEAEDALQNAYVKAFRAVQAQDIRPAVSRTWLYRVVYHCCIDELRRAGRSQHDVLDDLTDTRASPETESALVRALSQALLHLPAPTRAAVLLVDVHGLSYDEAATVLEVPRGTIASRLNHGRSALRQALRDYSPEWRHR